MNNKVVLKAENISKQYRLGYVGSGSLKDDARRWWARMRGKEDPLLTIGETNDRSKKGESDYVWALKDINFEIEQGDTVGIIGRNGAGKSTLLKILSKVTAPTTGNIKVKGRIASLLEVGTGFHGELTGRENIYLNGAIMGMRKHEITRKLDEIVDFAGVERYLDTPVKRYSSGMYVRLGFAVAAHLENEILIVDEVLAVGDAEFQKKCLGKLGDVSKGEGRSVLFVSHNIDSINKLCNLGIYLNNGIINFQGNIEETINKYLISSNSKKREKIFNKKVDGILLLTAKIINSKDELAYAFKVNEDWKIIIGFEVNNNIYDYVFGIGIQTYNEIPINTSWSDSIKLSKGKYELEFKIANFPLQAGSYKIVFGITKNKESLYYDSDFFQFDIENITTDSRIEKADGSTGILAVQFETNIKK